MSPPPTPPIAIDLDQAESLLDVAAETYQSYARLFDCSSPAAPPDQLDALAREAWPPLQEELAATIRLFAEHDPAAARRAERLASGWASRLREVASAGNQGEVLWDTALRSVLWQAIAARAEGQPPPAIGGASADRFLKELPRFTEACLARLFIEAGDLRHARSMLERGTGGDPATLAARVNLALEEGALGVAQGALTALEATRAEGEEIADLQDRLVAARVGERIDQGDAQGALELAAMAGRSRQSPTLEHALGLALRAAGRPCASLPHLALARRAGALPWLELGRSRLVMGDAIAAHAFFAAASGDNGPPSEAAAVARALADRLEGAPRRALTELSRTFPPTRASSRVRLAQAAALNDLGNGKEAITLLLDHPTADSDPTSSLRELARAFRLSGDLGATRACLDRIFESSGVGFPDLVELALVAVAEGDSAASRALVETYPHGALRPQEYFHLTSWPGEHTDSATRALEALCEVLAEHGVPLVLELDPSARRARYHLAQDLAPEPGAEASVITQELVEAR